MDYMEHRSSHLYGLSIDQIEYVVDDSGAYVGSRRLAFDENGIDRVEFMISANPGVNPSLTITAITEYAMDQIPAKAGASKL